MVAVSKGYRYPPIPSPNLPHYVYHIWGESGALLYVGMSYNVKRRMDWHRCKDYGEPIARVTKKKYPTRPEAHEAEKEAIRRDNPLHNKERYRYNNVLPPLDSISLDWDGIAGFLASVYGLEIVEKSF